MRWWSNYVERQEQLRASQGAHLKIANSATVGLDCVTNERSSGDELDALKSFVSSNIAVSASFFAEKTPLDFALNSDILTFTSPGSDGAHTNDKVFAKLYRARGPRAILLMPHWNATRHSYHLLASNLARLGITVLQLSLPYHDERQTRGVGYAREMVSENLGATIRANRQGVVDARACLDWLSEAGYHRLGIVGSSLGSSLASIVASHDDRVKAAIFLLMADDFAEVVWTSTATQHLRHSLELRFSFDDIKSAWAVVSPWTYAPLLAGRMTELLVISGLRDRVFLPYLTERWIARIRALGMRPTWVRYGCGHYTLGILPYNLVAFMRVVAHLRERL